MALVTGVVLPNNGDRIKVENYNDPINKILTQINGNIDSANIVAGSLPWSVMSTQAGVIPDTALVDKGGWRDLAVTPTVVSSAGQKEHVIRYAGVNYTDRLQPGTKLRIPRTGVTPTTSMAFVAASSQYASKTSPTGITFTDNFTLEAWVYLNSYTQGVIIGRSDVTAANGAILRLESDGRPSIGGYNAGAGNYRVGASYQSVPLGKWTHVAATWATGTLSVYIDGVLVPSLTSSGGTNPTTVVNAGDLAVGRHGSLAGQYFDGKVVNARIWSTVRTPAQIRNDMNQETPTVSTGLVGQWKGNGSWNDSSANANHLTAAGGAINNFASHPYSATEYAIITAATFTASNTDVTVFTGNGTLPNETLGATSFSFARTPFGFPADRGKWRVETLFVGATGSTPSNNVWYQPQVISLIVPTGAFNVGYDVSIRAAAASGAAFAAAAATLSTTTTTETDTSFTTQVSVDGASSAMAVTSQVTRNKSVVVATPTTYNLLHRTNTNGVMGSTNGFSNTGINKVTAECPYI